MTPEEYKEKLKSLQDQFDRAKKDLAIEYVKENAKYKIGDMITDHAGTIKINVIRAYVDLNGFPSPLYSGIQYTKSGQIAKRQDHTLIYEFNVINHKPA